jgi:hypothetical protein
MNVPYCPDPDSLQKHVPRKQNGVRWVTAEEEEEWVAQRASIKRLYLDEGRTLKEVMCMIEKDYGFKAT